MKKALLVGINYIGTSSELQGCINDVNNMKSFLLSRGYLEENITVLTDQTNTKPTRDNIISNLSSLINSSATSLFFHYSGHGTSLRDLNRDESDGKDEAICPLDYQSAGFIVDDQLVNIISQIRSNAFLTIVLDCCFSGTGVDLPYVLYQRNTNYALIADGPLRKRIRGKVICFSGCKDNQTSADTVEEGKNQGAMTYAFLKNANNSNFSLLFTKLQSTLRGKYSQIPSFSSSYVFPMNTTLNF